MPKVPEPQAARLKTCPDTKHFRTWRSSPKAKLVPKNAVRSLRCPTCRKIVLRSEPEFPFCSERCRLIDLGKWASGGYVISSPLNDPETNDSTYPNANVKKPN